MRAPDFFGIWADCLRFIGKNRGKFLIVLLIAVLACILGVVRSFAVEAATIADIPSIERYNIVILISGKRGFFGYFAFSFLGLFCVSTVIFLCGMRPLLSFCGILSLAIFSYMAAYFIGLLFSIAGLSVLLVSLACLIPCLLLSMFALAFVYIHTVCAALNRPRYRYFTDYFLDVKRAFLLNLAVISAIALIETVLVCVLTIGLVL